MILIVNMSDKYILVIVDKMWNDMVWCVKK